MYLSYKPKAKPKALLRPLKATFVCDLRMERQVPLLGDWRQVSGMCEYTWRGAYAEHDHCSSKNLCNGFLCATAVVPSVFFVIFVVFGTCATETAKDGSWCTLLVDHPFFTVNLLFFVNVTVGFWVIGWIQKSMWLIDPYWTILPPLIGHFYRELPQVQDQPTVPTRATVSLLLVWVWAVRLTINYFRRENWKFGEREDWRYTKMQKDFPTCWPVLSFFAVGLAQQPLLVGITWPLEYTNYGGGGGSDSEYGADTWTIVDSLATTGCVVGLTFAHFADNQLRDYMLENETRRKEGRDVIPLLNTGLWKYSRHPNYFGEQLFWWSVALFAIGVGAWWTAVGTLLNSIVLAIVTVMTEEKMVTNWTPARVHMYRLYQRDTSVLIPLPKRHLICGETDPMIDPAAS
ncbi:unnamed protein product [Amoebophrya sp. A120]|nr:unnamed protein product [Amoebophrya sp. A120]|eukprot:GSA120T00002785001.1